MSESEKKLVGGSEVIHFPEIDLSQVPARIDTGARMSSIWGSTEEQEGTLKVVFFGPGSDLYTGHPWTFQAKEYEQVVVASSMGHVQKRFKIKLLVKLKGKKVRAAFTIADRSTQVYPVLIGRNVLRGKFVVDVRTGKRLREEENQRIQELSAKLKEL